MATNIESQGTVIKMGNAASPEVFTTIPLMKTVGGPSGSATVIDVTNLSSTAKEKLMGLHDNGQIQLEGHYDPNDVTQAAMITAKEAATLKNFQLVLPSSPTETWSFAAFILSFNISAGVDQVITASATLEISGAVTRA